LAREMFENQRKFKTAPPLPSCEGSNLAIRHAFVYIIGMDFPNNFPMELPADGMKRRPMKKYNRATPQFSLCGLNCALCPKYRTSGDSRCPGCGGPDFYDKHPSCGVVSCSLKHGGVAYCFHCDAYPCAKYTAPNEKDSFISYFHVKQDMKEAASGLGDYLSRLDKKSRILDELLENWDNGWMKAFYCLAVNLLPLEALETVMEQLEKQPKALDATGETDAKIRGNMAKESLEALASEQGISLKLRK
jgi:hypothetical protein